MVKGLHKVKYEDRLKALKLFPLKYRRLRGDMIEVFKILNGFDRIDFKQFFKYADTVNLRGHSKKLFQKPVRLQIRQHFFSQRVVAKWNSLPETVISSSTILMFKNRLDKFFNYGLNNLN